MMLAFKIALRNVRAHSRRNLIIFAVTSGVSFFLFLFLSFSDGEIENIKNGVSTFWSPYADLKAVQAEQRSTDHPISGTPAITEALLEVPGVKEAIGLNRTLWGMDLFAGGKKYLDFNLLPLQPGDATFHSRITITSGRDLGSRDKNSILLHTVVGQDLPIRLGDEVTVVGKDYFGQLVSRRLTVAGFYTPMADNPNLYGSALVDPASFADLCGYAPGESNEILIRLNPGTDPRQMLKTLQGLALPVFEGLKFYLPSDDEFENGNTLVFGMIRTIIVAMVLITLLITAFGIMNVVSVNLYDRKKEIGTYFCLGSEKPFLLATYTIEIVLVNFAGSVAGVAAGLAARAGVNALNLTTTDPGLQVVLGGGRFTLGLSPSTLFWILGGISLITLLTALTTLGKALNVPPVVAVKESE